MSEQNVSVAVSEQPSWGVIVWKGEWTRDDCKDNRRYLFVYGDNLMRSGCKGQARLRGERNAMGIVTKKKPNMKETSFYSDADYNDATRQLDLDVEAIHREMNSGDFTHLVIPSDCWGTGLAELNVRAPQIYDAVEEVYDMFFNMADD